MEIERIKELARYDKSHIGFSEEDVKINFIVPILEALGFKRNVNFEYKRTDIIVRKGLPTDRSLLVETKKYKEPLSPHIVQLKRYWDEERCLLAIISNADEIWIFSPFWRGRRFEKTCIMKINRIQLADEEIIKKISTMISKEALLSGLALEKIKELENEIENIESKIEENENEAKKLEFKRMELENEKATKIKIIEDEYKKEIDRINEKIQKIKGENEELHRELPYIIPKGPVILPPPPEPMPTKEDYSIADASTSEYVNYWGLIQGKQIMVCQKIKRKTYKWFLWCKGSPISKYKLSPEGEEFLKDVPKFQGSSYIADVEYLQVPGDKIEFWKKLYTEKLFPFWDPKEGPYSFMKGATSQYIVLCRVYRIDATIEEKDVKKIRIGATINNRKKLDEIQRSMKIPIITDVEFEKIKNRIKVIINEYR